MIKAESISIYEFRGIRELTLDLKAKNFSVCGPNGTGKSGVVDAVEFALTGNVSRLSGEGKGGVSLKQHGPHVDKRNDPGKARVIVKIFIPSLNKTATVERGLKNPSDIKVTPNDAEILAVLNKVEAHPEIVLSRRELIRYVLATPGDRAKEVQALLHLDQVEKVRAGLLKIANSCEKQLPTLESTVVNAREQLLRALEIADLTKDKLLTAVNARRAVMGLPAIAELTETTSLKDGMAAPVPAQPQRISKGQALADIAATRAAIAEVGGEPIKNSIDDIRADLLELSEDPALLASVQQEKFYTTGFDLIDAQVCPFCDTSWNPEGLKKHVRAKINHLKEISEKRTAAEKKIAPLIETMRNLRASVETVCGYASRTVPPVNADVARNYAGTCQASIEKMTAFLPITDTTTALAEIRVTPQGVIDVIGELEKAVNALPEPTKQDAARDWLTIAHERLEVYRDAMRKQKAAKEKAKVARQVSDTYVATSDKVLTDIYAAVQKDFAALYAFVNRVDEDKFQAKLTPSMGKLGFDVDFYGRGFFPPGAYHSEGHQDGMGLCLYLALMRHLQGDGFTFAVLDDVLMSVDSGHRREVCALLKKEFPNTQFVMTTHDPIWLRHMRTEGLIGGRSAIQFKSWSVDRGPTPWDDVDVWTECAARLEENDVKGAAGTLRHYLEYVSGELCHKLRTPVEFRGDAQYQLGELLPAAITRMRKLYSSAKAAANSWGQKDLVELLSKAEAKFGALADASKAEQWQVNTAIHYNSWDNLGKGDFEPVVKAFRALLAGFACEHCGSYLRVSPEREAAEALRCDCGQTNINLRKKAG